MSESRKVSNVSEFETKKYQTHANGPLSTRSPHSNPPHPSTRWWIVLKSGLPGPLSEPSSEPPEPLSPMPLAPAAELLSEPLESPHHGSMGRWWKNTRVSSPRLILHWIHLQQNIRPASRSRSCRKLYQLSTTKKNEQVRRTASLTQKSVIRGFGVSCTVPTSNISTFNFTQHSSAVNIYTMQGLSVLNLWLWNCHELWLNRQPESEMKSSSSCLTCFKSNASCYFQQPSDPIA